MAKKIDQVAQDEEAALAAERKRLGADPMARGFSLFNLAVLGDSHEPKLADIKGTVHRPLDKPLIPRSQDEGVKVPFRMPAKRKPAAERETPVLKELGGLLKSWRENYIKYPQVVMELKRMGEPDLLPSDVRDMNDHTMDDVTAKIALKTMKRIVLPSAPIDTPFDRKDRLAIKFSRIFTQEARQAIADALDARGIEPQDRYNWVSTRTSFGKQSNASDYHVLRALLATNEAGPNVKSANRHAVLRLRDAINNTPRLPIEAQVQQPAPANLSM